MDFVVLFAQEKCTYIIRVTLLSLSESFHTRLHFKKKTAKMATLVVSIMCIVVVKSWYISNITLPASIYEQQLGYRQNPTSTDIVDIYLFGGNLGTDCKRYIWKSGFNKTSKSLSPFQTLSVKTIKQCIDSEMQNCVSIGDMVYFVGVYDYDFTYYPTGNVYRFNMETEEWMNISYIPQQPIPQIKGCITTNMTHIFSIGGLNYTKPPVSEITNKLQIYDIANNEWSVDRINLPFPMVYQYCNMVNNIIYTFGGQITYTGNGKYNGIYKYDVINGDSWEFIGNLSRNSALEKGWLVYDYMNGYLYPVGGEPFGDGVDIFDVKSESIKGESVYNSVSDEVQSAPVLVIEDTILVFGGSMKDGKRTDAVLVGSLPLTPSKAAK